MPATDAPQPTRVLFTCPAGDRSVFTGHRMRPAEFSALKDPRSFRCPVCSSIHTWTTETAWCETKVRLG